MRSTWSVLALGLLCSMVSVVGCSRSTDSPKHLVLIVVDTLRADVLGCYGGPANTPNIDRLASKGIRFDLARTHIPITGPSHTTLFSSRLPHQHGVLNNTQVIPEDVETLALILQKTGFRTTGVVSLGVLASKFGFSRGFDRYENQTRQRFWRDAAEVNEVVLPLIPQNPDQRQFLWVHYSDPHSPYASPVVDLPSVNTFLDGRFVTSLRLDGRRFSIPMELAPGETEFEVRPTDGDQNRRLVFRRLRFNGGTVAIEGRKNLSRSHERETIRTFQGRSPLRAALVNQGVEPVAGELVGTIEFPPRPEEVHDLYRQEVEFVDSEIGRLIEALRSAGIWDDSLVIFVSDHGEGLGDSGRFGHVNHLSNETLRVPLILLLPGRMPAEAVVTTPVRLIDVLPTALDVLGVELGPDIMGEPLLPLVDQAEPNRPSVSMTFQPEAKHDRGALVDGGYKYIWTIDTDVRELFDLRSDPRELENIANQTPDVADAMHAKLVQVLAASREGNVAPFADLGQEEIEGLEALGYVH